MSSSVKHKNSLCYVPSFLPGLPVHVDLDCCSWAEQPAMRQAEGKKRNCNIHLSPRPQRDLGGTSVLPELPVLPFCWFFSFLYFCYTTKSYTLHLLFKSQQQTQIALQQDLHTVPSCATINFPADYLLLAFTRLCQLRALRVWSLIWHVVIGH